MMEPKESVERLMEGLTRAASCARQLGRAQQNSVWTQLALSLDALANTAKQLYNNKPLNRQAALAMIDHLVAKNAIQPGSQKIQ